MQGPKPCTFTPGFLTHYTHNNHIRNTNENDGTMAQPDRSKNKARIAPQACIGLSKHEEVRLLVLRELLEELLQKP